jgi:hypothetical protein
MEKRIGEHNPHASLSSRLLSVFLTILPVVILITSFVLAAVSSASKEWAYRSYFNNGDDMTFVGYQYRSPFVSCSLDPIINPNTMSGNGTTKLKRSQILPGWQESCPRVHSPRGFCDFADAARYPSNVTLLCHHLSISAQLLYAGCALTAAALLIVLILTAISLPHVIRTGSVRFISSTWALPGRRSKSHHHHHHRYRRNQDYFRPSNNSLSSYMVLLLRLLAGLGGLALFTAMIVGTTALVVLNFPIGDFTTTPAGVDPTVLNHAGPWLVGRAVGWCGAAAVLAAVACHAVGLVWEEPHVGLLEEHREDEGGDNGKFGEPQVQGVKEGEVVGDAN